MWVVGLFWACRDRRRSPGRPVTPTPTWRTHSSSSVSQTASSSQTHRAQTDRVTIMSHSRDTGSRGHASFNWKYWVKSHNRQTEERDQHRQLTWLHNGRSKDDKWIWERGMCLRHCGGRLTRFFSCTYWSSLRNTIQVMLTPMQKADSSNTRICGRLCKYGRLFSGILGSEHKSRHEIKLSSTTENCQ